MAVLMSTSAERTGFIVIYVLYFFLFELLEIEIENVGFFRDIPTS